MRGDSGDSKWPNEPHRPDMGDSGITPEAEGAGPEAAVGGGSGGKDSGGEGGRGEGEPRVGPGVGDCLSGWFSVKNCGWEGGFFLGTA